MRLSARQCLQDKPFPIDDYSSIPSLAEFAACQQLWLQPVLGKKTPGSLKYVSFSTKLWLSINTYHEKNPPQIISCNMVPLNLSVTLLRTATISEALLYILLTSFPLIYLPCLQANSKNFRLTMSLPGLKFQCKFSPINEGRWTALEKLLEKFYRDKLIYLKKK